MTSLTSEQQAVVDSRARLLAVNAFAGTGKTSTLVEYAKARPRQRILYIAFNKSVATDAKERFPEHVECRTTHSLAFAAQGRRFVDKLGNPQAFEIAQACNCNPRRAKLVLATVSAWLCSSDEDIGIDHVDRELVPDDVDAAAVVDQARLAWSRMLDLRSAIKMPHDGYLKLWALTRPKLRYDIILLDEAQDTNPLTLDLVLAQRHATLVLVGDRHQGIYGFRKALNAMELVQAEQNVALTRSFRFGSGIAAVATELLQRFKGEENFVQGRSDIEVRWNVDKEQHYALLGRTNAGLFQAAAEVVLAKKDRKLHFVGGFDSYVFGKVLDAYHLWADERMKIKDPGIARFENFTEFQKYGDDAADAEIKALARVVDQYRTRIPAIHDALRAADCPVEDQADLTVSTVHRAKGLEWTQVFLADDFIELPPPADHDPEEINLLYVGITRAIEAIRLPDSTVDWLDSVGFDAPERSAEVSTAQAPAPAQVDASQVKVVLNWVRSNAHLLAPATVDELERLLRSQARAAVHRDLMERMEEVTADQ